MDEPEWFDILVRCSGEKCMTLTMMWFHGDLSVTAKDCRVEYMEKHCEVSLTAKILTVLCERREFYEQAGQDIELWPDMFYHWEDGEAVREKPIAFSP